ncbi:MAG: hypothetical protein RIT45_1506 [Pseudomonadota bacterium]
MREGGTDLASSPPRRGRGLLPGASVRAVARKVVAWSWVPLLLVGCVVLPDVVTPEPDGPALLWIDPTDLDPQSIEDLELVNTELLSLRVRNVEASSTVKQPLRYYWYLDLELVNKELPVAIYTICPSSGLCVINHCERINDLDRHTVTLVIADQPLAEGALDPFDFPQGTAYAWVQWGFRQAEGACSQ